MENDSDNRMRAAASEVRRLQITKSYRSFYLSHWFHLHLLANLFPSNTKSHHQVLQQQTCEGHDAYLLYVIPQRKADMQGCNDEG